MNQYVLLLACLFLEITFPTKYAVSRHGSHLGFKDGDKVAIGGEDLELHVKLFVKDEVPKGGAVISLGFSDFPLTRALDGSRCRGIELSLAKE